MTNKPWKGRFSQETNRVVEEFTASISFDKRLYEYDIMGSIAHAKMLAKVGVITNEEMKRIITGLGDIKKEIEQGKFSFSKGLEDIHMNIESGLIEKIGEIGEKLHTARSRNDQIALDMRLYLRDEIKVIMEGIRGLLKTIIEVARENIDIVMPGYTHLQRAQPVLFAHHIMAYCEMLRRDRERFKDCLKRVNVMPLGAGALAGTTFPVDRDYLAELLNFPEVTENSIDSVSDRDFCIEFCCASSILIMHLSRLSEELILWSAEEFGFIEIAEPFTTGSSMMPQKKNPDVPELTRGKTGRIYGNLINLLTIMKGLPLAYNRDMQEDKLSIFDTADTLKECLTVLTPLLKDIKLNRGAISKATEKGFLTATDIADYLVRKGMSFRKAHEVVGRSVRYCLEKNKELKDLTLKEWKRFSEEIDEGIFNWTSIKESVERRGLKGGTATKRVCERIEALEKEIGK